MIKNGSLIIQNVFKYSKITQIKRQNQCNIANKLKFALSPTFLSVNDTTLGVNSCGRMYKITVQSPLFIQKTKVEQHRLVVNAISQQMKAIHGFSLKTRVPPKEQLLQSSLSYLEDDQQ